MKYIRIENSCNTYIITNASHPGAIVIDPGSNVSQIRGYIGNQPIACVLLTHGHFDHDDVGRTDLPGGDFAALRRSITGILAMDGVRELCPGHGQATTPAAERKRFTGVPWQS